MSQRLKELFVELAEKADVVTVDSGAYCQFNRDIIRSDRDNALLSVSWIDECQKCRCAITEEAFETENHPSVDFGTGIFRVMDSEGEKTQLRFYRLKVLKG